MESLLATCTIATLLLAVVSFLAGIGCAVFGLVEEEAKFVLEALAFFVISFFATWAFFECARRSRCDPG